MARTPPPPKPAAPQRPATAAKRPPDRSDWTHGPVAAAVNLSWLLILAGVLIRAVHIPPVVGLVVGVVLAVALAAAGATRKPRPLAPRSLLYRSGVAVAAGMWVWVDTADFTHIRPGAGAGLLLTLGGVAAGGVAGLLRGHRTPALVAAVAAVAATGGGLAVLAAADAFRVFTTAGPLNRHMFGHWLLTTLVVVAVLAAAAAIVGTSIAHHERDLDTLMGQALTLRSAGAQQLRVQRLLQEAANNPAVTVTEVQKWANGAGESYLVDARASGVTPEQLNRHADWFAAREDLLEGCKMEAFRDGSRGRIRVAVSRVNKIKDSVDYPGTFCPRSVYNGLPVGIFADGEEVEIMIRESSVFAWGQKRSGKTTLLYAIICGLCQCTDALIWVIDLGGGGAALPFLYAWAEGRVDTPAIDWVATTVEEAELMADLALKIALDRKVHYRHRKRKANTTLLPLDAEVPEIVIVIDEGAEILGLSGKTRASQSAMRAKSLLEEVVRMAGDSGVNVVVTGLAATEGVVGREVLAQLPIRIGMRVTDTRELAYGFDNYYGLNIADAPYQGTGFAKAAPDAPVRVIRGYNVLPDLADRVAVATAPWRPRLDDRGVELGGAAYRRRWERTRHLLADEDGKVLVDFAGDGHRATPTSVVSAAGPAPVQVPAAVPEQPQGTRTRPDIPEPPPGVVLPQHPSPEEASRPLSGIGPVDPNRTLMESAARLREMEAIATGAAPAPVAPVDLNDPVAVRTAFADMVARAGRLGSEPPELAADNADNPNGPAVLEALVRHHGAGGIVAKELLELLACGGPWGPAVRVSNVTVYKWLAPGKNQEPAGWLAGRDPRAPYVHKDVANQAG